MAAATAFLSPLHRMNLRRKAVAAATRTPRSVSPAFKFGVLDDSQVNSMGGKDRLNREGSLG